MKLLRPTFIVGIGGSAGALSAYKTLLGALSPKTGMAFVIISHMNPTASSQLALILSRHTKMPVTVAGQAMSIESNHVYVIPPNADLLIKRFKFKIISPRSSHKMQINSFFISLAEAMGACAVGIVLSGYNGDGTEGCKQIKEKGGTTFAQDGSAEVNHMPLSAQHSGCIDFVLPVDKIPDQLERLVSTFLNQRIIS